MTPLLMVFGLRMIAVSSPRCQSFQGQGMARPFLTVYCFTQMSAEKVSL